MTIESASATNVQIKSRRADRGPFSASDAAKHIIDSWTASQEKATKPATQWVVFEGAIDTSETVTDLSRPLQQALATGSDLHTAVIRRGARELTAEQLDDLLACTAVWAVPWAEVDERTLGHVSNVATGVERAGHALIVRSLQVEIGSAAAANATPDPNQREALDKTRMVSLIVSAAELIDVEGLDKALSTGVCSLFDWTVGADTGDRFYEGESTQPGHVASGLVVERPDLLEQVVTGTQEDRPVILTGPSGIGKSAVLWTIPRFLPGVTWFRVDRLQGDDDANLMMRLARAFGATSTHPVGFLIDGAGAGQLAGWPAMRTRAAAVDGVLLFATARNEDLVQLGGLAGTTTIDVVLDETSAMAIYDGLKRRGVTSALHWKEAYEQSHGLTLEFTYLLTQGKRLQEVIADQIADRVRDDRSEELDLLALVAVAHQWGATLELERVAEALGAQAPTQLRQPIQRLVNEHLLVETNGLLSGLHPVRSSAISEAIHATPPPVLASTFAAVLRALDGRQVPRFITSALRDHPELADTVINVSASEEHAARRLAGFLQGLRLSDSEQAIREWLTILDEEGVKRSNQQFVVTLALAGSDMGEMTPETIRASLDRMALVESGHRRDDLADRIGAEVLTRIVFDADPHDARALVATLHGWGTTLDLPPDAMSTPLMQTLSTAPLSVLAEIVSTLIDHDDEFGVQLINLMGGEEAMLELIRAQEPWLLNVEVDQTAEGPVAVARLLHVSDDAQGNTRDRCVALARTLLRLLPSIVKPDVEGLWPGGRRIEVGGHAFALSGLLREYDHNETEVAWNQARSTIAQALLGVPDSVRLTAAEPVLRNLAAWLRDLTNRWVRGEFPGSHDPGLVQRAIQLEDAGYSMPPGLGRGDIDPGVITETTKTSTLDVVSSAITNVTDMYLRLREVTNPLGEAMYVRDHVVKGIENCLQEPWHLIDNGDRAISNLNQIVSTARDLADVLSSQAVDEAHRTAVRRAATSGTTAQALRRASDMARRLLGAEIDTRRQVVADAVSAVAQGCSIEVRGGEHEGGNRFVVLVEGLPLYEYFEVQDAIVAAVQELNRPLDTFLILPTRHGKRFEQIGVHLIINPLPLANVEGWEDLVPDAHQWDLARLIQTCMLALQVLSGIADLSEQAREHPEVVAVGEEAAATFSATFKSLAESEDEFALHAAAHLAELAERVNAEIDGTSQAETFAAGIYRGLSGDPSDELTQSSLLHICALEWPVDEQGVRNFLAT